MKSGEKRPILMQQDCPGCAGEGVLVFRTCQLCDMQVQDEDLWLLSGESPMPCGHTAADFTVTQTGCRDCLGTGWINEEIPWDVWQAQRWRRIQRGIMVIALTAVPTLIFVLYIFRNEPLPICSSLFLGLSLIWGTGSG